MADHLSPEKRSWNMARIRSKNTKPEVAVRKYLYSKGFRYRLYAKDVNGKPDLCNKRKKIAVFVNGCFWHQHRNCSRSTIPKSNKSYWIPKLNSNVSRFKKNINDLKSLDWKVFIIWECEINNDIIEIKAINETRRSYQKNNIKIR
tara:strand:+ start:192 stop:629 length:438 start_codon:yes stop_codon:yes gene_type:complete